MIPDIVLSTQAATLISGLTGGIIGSFGTYIARTRLREKRNSERSDWLRQVLLSELESMEALDALGNSTNIPQGDWLHNQVFENMSSELGMLDSDELSALLNFHGKAEHAQSDIQRYRSTRGQSEKKEEIINNQIINIKRERKAAIHLLSDNIEGSSYCARV